MTSQQTHPLTVYLLIAAIVFQGASGLAGGYGLTADPSGASLGIPLNWLEGSPFDDYAIPGIILFVVLGVLPLLVAYGLWRRTMWGWYGAALVGIALIIWIGVEILVIGYQPQPPLQLIYGTLGMTILILTRLPSVRRYYAAP